jgi:hypothetical protein
MSFSFSPTKPRLWNGRYARIPGGTTTLHLRRTGGEWWPFVDWRVESDTAQCPMVDTGDIVALAAAVNAGKGFLGGDQGGAFQINEYGQVLVPNSFGDRRVALVGECGGPSLFHDEFNGGDPFDLTDDRALECGDTWPRPYLGIPHNLSAASELYFWNQGSAGAWKMTPPCQDDALVEALRTLRPYGPIRFVVGCGGLVLTKVPVGPWTDGGWEPRYVMRLNYRYWFSKEY